MVLQGYEDLLFTKFQIQEIKKIMIFDESWIKKSNINQETKKGQQDLRNNQKKKKKEGRKGYARWGERTERKKWNLPHVEEDKERWERGATTTTFKGTPHVGFSYQITKLYFIIQNWITT